MTFAFKDLIDFDKIPIKVFIIASLLSGFFIFGKKELLLKLDLIDFKNDYGKYFGVVFLVSTLFIAFSIIYWIFGRLVSNFINRKHIKSMTKDLEYLDESEKATLREFIIQGRKSVYMPIDNPTVASLIHKGFLIYVSNIGTAMYFPLSLSKIADKKLVLKDLDISNNPSEEESRLIMAKRPSWATDYFYSDILKKR